jgi:uncharacterized protein with NRDE domain
VCLIVVAHQHSAELPLVIAANRDELYERPTRDAHFWLDAPEVVGGLDRVSGGSWLAIARSGRWAAVTNLRGAQPQSKSRGALVRDFVLSASTPEAHAAAVNADGDAYAGFHLLSGVAGESLHYASPASNFALRPGIYSFSNAAFGEEWPKMRFATETMRALLAEGITDANALVPRLMRFLQTPRGTDSPMSEIFVPGDPYGTRASTVIVATRASILFAEQTYERGGVPNEMMKMLTLPLD